MPGLLEVLFLARLRADTVGQRHERDHAERRRRRRVAPEEPAEVVLGEQTAEGQPARPADVHCQSVEGERGHALLARQQVRDERAGGRPVELTEQRDREHQRIDDGEARGAPEREREGRRGEHRERDRVPASQAIREESSCALRDEAAQPVAGDREARLRR